MSRQLTIGSLFSGIGGLELGLEWAGLGPVIWQVEKDPYCRAVLAKHWPNARRFEDARRVHAGRLIGDGSGRVRVICAGMPCQPISQAAARSERADGAWLWPDTYRIIEGVQPDYVIIEQPEAIRYARRGLDQILGDLANLGYDAEWRTIRASDLGAPHHRARLWVVAYAHGVGEPTSPVDAEASWLPEPKTVREWPAPRDIPLDDGVPDRVLRRSRLGNAVVPQVAEVVGRVVLEIDRQLAGTAAESP